MWRRARQLGFLGPGPVEDHLRHAAAFRDAVPAPATALDLGSGGGVPGLALAVWWPGSTWVLLDASERRTVFLEDAVETVGVADRVSVVNDPAEGHARDEAARGGFDLVVARSFGPPAVVAECGAPFLRVGGRLVVSEPPYADLERWPAAELGTLGLAVAGENRSPDASVIVLRLEHLPSASVPRRAGVPKGRPLW